MAKKVGIKTGRKVLNPIFHLQNKKENDCQLSLTLLKNTRKTGKLNLSSRNLSLVPERLWRLYERDEDVQDSSVDYNMCKSEDFSWWNYQPLHNLDLSSNCLTDIPSSINIFQDLIVFNLNDNILTNLPTELNELKKLTKLNVCHNKLTIIPDCIFKLTDLQSLLISHNNIEMVSKDISDLIMLQEVDMSHNYIENLPPGMGYMVRLTQLNLSHNKLLELPPDIVNMRALVKLDLTSNQLTALPPLGELRKLQLFYAAHNNILKIPDCEGCANLQEIYLANNYIQEISPEFCENMFYLKVLDLKDNKIAEIPEDISKMKQLIRLDMTNNSLSNLPNSLCLLTHLQSLRLDGNQIRSIRRDIIQCGTSRILKFLRERCHAEQLETIEGDQLSKVPQSSLEIFADKYEMSHTHSLSVSMQQLTSVPDEILQRAKEANVRIVDLSRNQFQRMPSNIDTLSENITELNFSVNLLTIIPECISQFRKLQYLNISSNLLTELPDCLGELKNLRELVISNNKFVEIPSCVYEIENIEIILASVNQIKIIDTTNLQKLKRLTVLDLSNNNLEHVPPELGNLTQLRSLQITGNSFRQPRYAVLVKGTDSILAYLRDRIPT